MWSRIVIGFLLLSSLAMAADKQQQAQALWDRAQKTSWFMDGKLPAFHVVVHFLMESPGQPPVRGEYRRDYLDQAHFRDETSAGEFSDIHIVNGDKSWRNDRNAPWRMALMMTATAIPPFHFNQMSDKVGRISGQGIEGVSTSCIEYNPSIVATVSTRKRSYSFSRTKVRMLFILNSVHSPVNWRPHNSF